MHRQVCLLWLRLATDVNMDFLASRWLLLILRRWLESIRAKLAFVSNQFVLLLLVCKHLGQFEPELLDLTCDLAFTDALL